MSAGGTRSRLARATGVALLAGTLAGGLAAGWAAVGAAQDKVTIHWYVGLGAPEAGAKERTQAINRVVRAFNKDHPDIRLVADIEAGDPFVTLAQRIAVGDVPDLVGPLSTRALTAFEDSWADLGPLVDSSGFDLSVFDPGMLGAYRDADGSLMGLPLGAFPTVMYFNRDLFDEAGLAYPPATLDGLYTMPDGTEVPWDYETVAEVAKLLTLDRNGNDATSPDFDPNDISQFGYHEQYAGLLRALTSIGGPGSMFIEDASGSTNVVIPDDWRAAAQWLHTGIWDDHFMPNSTQIASLRLGSNPFASGNVGMATAPLWYTCCIFDSRGRDRDDWDIGVMPVGLDGNRTSPLGADTFGILSSSTHPEEAFAALQYLITDAGAGGLWDVAPAALPGRPAWYERIGTTYPNVQNWAAADAMLAFPDIPSHQSDLPKFPLTSDRYNQFYQLLMSDAGAEMDVDAELTQLAADLQEMVGPR